MLKKIQIHYLKNLFSLFNKFIFNFKVKYLCYELKVEISNIQVVLSLLKYHIFTRCSMLIDIVVIDVLNKNKRFSLIYNLLSLKYNTRFFVKINFTELSKITSICSIYSGAN